MDTLLYMASIVSKATGGCFYGDKYKNIWQYFWAMFHTPFRKAPDFW